MNKRADVLRGPGRNRCPRIKNRNQKTHSGRFRPDPNQTRPNQTQPPDLQLASRARTRRPRDSGSSTPCRHDTEGYVGVHHVSVHRPLPPLCRS